MKERNEVAWAELTRQKFESLIGPLRAQAAVLGYALATHGSLSRDIDIIACPWTPDAVSAEELATAIITTVQSHNDGIALVLNDGKDEYDERRRNPSKKPHGRLAWSIHLGGGPYIDLSVMPRVRPACPRVPACKSIFDHADMGDCKPEDRPAEPEQDDEDPCECCGAIDCECRIEQEFGNDPETGAWQATECVTHGRRV